MASRLSGEALLAVYESGHQGFPVTQESPLDLVAPAPINLDELVAREDAEEQIQALPPQPLYHALVKRGLEDSLDVLPLLSQEQLVRIFDYDVWNQDQLVKDRAFKWLSLYRELGDEELHKRFRGLDEEYQLAILSPLIAIYDEEEYEALSQGEQDVLCRLPCGTLHYKILTEDTKQQELIDALVQACLASDINYTYSVLTHAAYLPPNEQEALIAQFRRARLEEDGFITYEESLGVFRPLDLERWRAKWARHGSGIESQAASVLSHHVPGQVFLSRVLQNTTNPISNEGLQQLHAGFAFLGNTLCAAAKIGADDVDALRRLLEQAQALASLGLEYLADGDISVGADIVSKEHPQVLFRAGLTLIGKLQGALVSRLELSELNGAEGLRKLWLADKRGSLLNLIESKLGEALGFERTEFLKGLFNRFPLKPVTMRKRFESDRLQGADAERVIYTPVATLSALQELARITDGLAGLLHLATLAKTPGSALLDLDRHLSTAIARVLIGGEFRADPLQQDEVQTLIEASQEKVQGLSTEFFKGVEGTLRTALLESTDAANEEGRDSGVATSAWAVSRALAVATHDPLQTVMTELSDLLLQLHQQREAARSGQRHGLLGLLFVSQA